MISIVFFFLFIQCDIFEIVSELRKQRYGMIQVKVSLMPICLMYIWKIILMSIMFLLSLNEISQLSQIMNIW